MGRPNGPRDPIAGPDTPEAPFPLKLRGPVIKGFGRGSKDLGIPTANIPPSGHEDLASGIYYGFCTLDHTPIASRTTTTSVPSVTRSTTPPPSSSSHAVLDLAYPSTPTTSSTVFPAVLSVGYNLYYGNSTRSIEIHIMHSFDKDFYGATLSLIILGFIRPEYDYVSKEALVEDIREDIRIGQRSLDREGYRSWREDSWFKGGEGEKEGGTAAKSEHGVGQRDGVAMCQME